MTCVAGVIDGGIGYMAADQGSTSIYDNIVRVGFAETKVIRLGNFLIGGAGNMIECQEDRMKLDTADLVGATTSDRRKELYARFVAVRPNFTNNYLVIHKGQLYTVWSNICITSQYDFIGSDTRAFHAIFTRLKGGNLTGAKLVSATVSEACSSVYGVACDIEGPTVLSI